MATRRILAIAMAVLLVGLPGVAGAAPQSVIGSLSGNVDAKTLKGGTYTVRVRDLTTNQIVQSQAPDASGNFTFTQLPLGHNYMVELFDTGLNKVVSTGGPYLLSTATSIVKTGVLVTSAGAAATAPAALWLLAAGAGTASAIATATESASR